MYEIVDYLMLYIQARALGPTFLMEKSLKELYAEKIILIFSLIVSLLRVLNNFIYNDNIVLN